MNATKTTRWLAIALTVGLTLPVISYAQGMGGGPGRGMGMGRNMPTFSEYDLNGDGNITEQEFNEARTQRRSERAQQGYPMRNAGNAPTFKELDGNGDGVVNADEFAAHQAQRFPKR